MTNRFLAWTRSGIHDLGTGRRLRGRHQAAAALQLEDGEGGLAGGAAPFELLGPLDVAGLSRSAIVGRVPVPGSVDASETRVAHIELEPEDLPWRYSPEPVVGATEALGPWLVLVAGTPAEITFAGNEVRIANSALIHHDLSVSRRWAHVHELREGVSGVRRFARILCPRDLLPDEDHVAVLVPAWKRDTNAEGLAPAWSINNHAVILPWYDRWTFRTGPAGDFETIASRLEPAAASELPADFGVAHVRHPANVNSPLPMRAALSAIRPAGSAQPDAVPPPAPVQAATEAASEPLEIDGRWVLGAPVYDEPWPRAPGSPAPAGAWRAELRRDFRRRAAAGLGTWAGIEWQQRISEAAAVQAGAMTAAAQRIRQLTLGLAATRALWDRRFPPSVDGRLALLGPALGRIPATHGDTALDRVRGRVTGRLGPALFSSAARRVLRTGPARTALAEPGANGLVAVMQSANRCPPTPPPDRVATGVNELLTREPPGDRGPQGPWYDLIRQARDQLERHELDRFDHLIRPISDALGQVAPDLLAAIDPGDGRPPDLDALKEAAGTVDRTRPSPSQMSSYLRDLLQAGEPPYWCAPLDLGELGRVLSSAVDPHVSPVTVERVLSTIYGLSEPVLAPPDLTPEIDLPMWRFLEERQRDWLLPGVGRLPTDRVVMVQTNPTFVDAFLVGANHQSVGELRWRNLPIQTGWTPLRRFWSRIPDPDGDIPNTDINGVGTWPADPQSVLGDPRHRTDPDRGEDLVVVFRTELFRRYPSALVYLYPANAVAGQPGVPDWSATPHPVSSAPPRRYPVFAGSIGPEVTFFGFRASPAEGRTHWVVLEEPPPGFRFRPPSSVPGGATESNGARYAAATFAQPVRVFLGNVL